MARAAATLIIVLVGALYYAIAGEDPQTTACQRQVNLVQASYRASPPRADSRKAIENTLKNARTWCGDKKFQEANAGIEMAAFLCVAGKGCQKLLEDAKRQRQSSR